MQVVQTALQCTAASLVALWCIAPRSALSHAAKKSKQSSGSALAAGPVRQAAPAACKCVWRRHALTCSQSACTSSPAGRPPPCRPCTHAVLLCCLGTSQLYCNGGASAWRQPQLRRHLLADAMELQRTATRAPLEALLRIKVSAPKLCTSQSALDDAAQSSCQLPCSCALPAVHRLFCSCCQRPGL